MHNSTKFLFLFALLTQLSVSCTSHTEKNTTATDSTAVATSLTTDSIDAQTEAEEVILQIIKAAGTNTSAPVKDDIASSLKVQYNTKNTQLQQIVSEWLSQNKESILGTTAGIISPKAWGVTTQKDKTLYVHILLRDNDTDPSKPTPTFGKGYKFLIKLPINRDLIQHTEVLNENFRVGIKKLKDSNSTALALSERPRSLDTIIKITLK